MSVRTSRGRCNCTNIDTTFHYKHVYCAVIADHDAVTGDSTIYTHDFRQLITNTHDNTFFLCVKH